MRARAPGLATTAILILVGGLSAQGTAIVGGTVHPVSGPPIENGVVLIEEGRIVGVGPAGAVGIEGAEVIEASGKIVTPGFFDASTQLGLIEVGSVPSTRHGSLDDGANRARFRVSDGLDPRSMLYAIVRSKGVTNAVAAPSGGVISGQGALLSLDAGSRADLILEDAVALYANLGPDAAGSAGGSRGGVVLELREALDEARDAIEACERAEREAKAGVGEAPDPPSPELAPLIAVLENELPLVVRASAVADIEMALELEAEYGFGMILDGGEEAWLVADRLAEARVPVMIRALENRPTQFHRLATRYEGPAILSEAGVLVILTTGSSHRAGQLPHEAGNAVRYGMAWDRALEAVTLAPAHAFVLDDRIGSLEPGKLANVVVWSDDPFEFSGYAERVFIEGEEIELDSRQRRLFERYRRLDP